MFGVEEIIERVLASSDETGTAYAYVPSDFEGACRVELSGRYPTTLVFASRQDAEAAAKFAVGTLGGYCEAAVYASEAHTPTHASWTQWAFES